MTLTSYEINCNGMKLGTIVLRQTGDESIAYIHVIALLIMAAGICQASDCTADQYGFFTADAWDMAKEAYKKVASGQHPD